MEEGVIKFNCEHTFAEALPDEILKELKHFRQQLYMEKLIGEDENGIGYGNISQRFGNSNKFIISGTQTGGKPTLNAADFTLVEEYNLPGNWLRSTGPVKASSESLTHAAIYLTDHMVNAVIHIHHRETWHKYINILPATEKNISYGSPEMAMAIKEICKKLKISKGVIIMGGHADGIIAFGKNMQEAYNEIQSIF